MLLKMLAAVGPVQSQGKSEQKWGEVYPGGAGVPGGSEGEPPKPEKDEEEREKGADKRVKRIVSRRQFLAALLGVGVLAVCERLGLLQLTAKGLGDAVGFTTEGEAGEVSVEERFIPVMGDKLAAEALRMLRDRKIDELPVVDRRGRPVGLLDVQDLLRAGFV